MAIWFGILHCIAAASLLALPLIEAPAWASLAAGAVAIALPAFVQSKAFDPPALLWLGLGESRCRIRSTGGRCSPWAGVALLGLGAARLPGVLDAADKARPLARAIGAVACDRVRRAAQPRHLSPPPADPDRSRLGGRGFRRSGARCAAEAVTFPLSSPRASEAVSRAGALRRTAPPPAPASPTRFGRPARRSGSAKARSQANGRRNSGEWPTPAWGADGRSKSEPATNIRLFSRRHGCVRGLSPEAPAWHAGTAGGRAREKQRQ